MIRHPAVRVVFSMGMLGLAVPWPSGAQAVAPATTRVVAAPSGGIEASLLRSLQANPVTAPYAFSTERRGAKVALRGRVGSKQVHDAAIQTAIALGVPVVDDLVIDTLAARQVASVQARLGAAYASAGPSSGLGGYPGAGYPNALPYLYPPPLFGRIDDPFFGFDPPNIAYPPWWGALSARRLGGPAVANANPPMAADPGAPTMANPPADPANPQAATAGLPDGTIDMEIDHRGVATLRGNVPSLAERIALGQRIAQTPGVSSVVNLLNVKSGVAAAPSSDTPPPPPVPADLPPQARAAVGPASPIEGPPIVADADPIGRRATRAISTRPGVANPSVKVKVRDGVASLSGRVPTVYEAMLAYRAVQRTPGVREVEDHLEFVVPDGNGPNPLADKGRPEDVEPYLEAQIRRQVGDLAHIDRVRVQGDSLDLRGTLDREEDRPRFDAIIRSMPILRGFRINAEMPAESR